jgi:hypothetical protein
VANVDLIAPDGTVTADIDSGNLTAIRIQAGMTP